MQKIIELAKRLDETGRYEEADFVVRRVAAAAESVNRREAQQANYGWWGANTANAVGAGWNNLVGNNNANLSSLYNQAVGLATSAQDSPLPEKVKKVLSTGFYEIAQALSALAARGGNASAANQMATFQQPAAKSASTTGSIRLAFMRDFSGASEAIEAFRGYTDQILRNINPQMERWIAQKLDYMKSALMAEKSGIESTSQGDWFTQNKTTMPVFVQRVQRWLLIQRTKGVANPDWQSHLSKNGVPTQIVGLIAPYIK